MKIGMNDLHYKHSAPMVLAVHDELVMYVEESKAVEFAHWLKDYVPQIIEINGVKFPATVSIGNNWKEVQEI